MERARRDKLGVGLKSTGLQVVSAAAIVSALETVPTTTLGGRDFHCDPFYQEDAGPESLVYPGAHSDGPCLQAVGAKRVGPMQEGWARVSWFA